MTKFADNNTLAATTEMFFFFVNKSYHSRMNFSSDYIIYVFTRERLLTTKTEKITDVMKNTLRVIILKLTNVKKLITKQINKHRKNVSY